MRNRKLHFGAVRGTTEPFCVWSVIFFSSSIWLPIPFPFASIFAAAAAATSKSDRCERKIVLLSLSIIKMGNDDAKVTLKHIYMLPIPLMPHDFKVCVCVRRWCVVASFTNYIIEKKVWKLEWANAPKKNSVTEMSMLNATGRIECYWKAQFFWTKNNRKWRYVSSSLRVMQTGRNWGFPFPHAMHYARLKCVERNWPHSRIDIRLPISIYFTSRHK